MKKQTIICAIICVACFVPFLLSANDQRIALLESTLLAKKEEGIKDILKALKDQDPAYRQAALRVTSGFVNEELYIRIIKATMKEKPDIKVDVLTWLAQEAQAPEKNSILKELEIRFDLPARQVFLNDLGQKNKQLKEAAMWTLVRIGDKKVIPDLANMLKDSDEEVIGMARKGLVEFESDVASAVAKVLSSASDAGKIAGVEILSERKATSTANTVFEVIRTGSPRVKEAGYSSLKNVVTFKDMIRLCGMLETAAPEAIKPLQEAVLASIATQSLKEQRSLIERRAVQAGTGKAFLYDPVLAALPTE